MARNRLLLLLPVAMLLVGLALGVPGERAEVQQGSGQLAGYAATTVSENPSHHPLWTLEQEVVVEESAHVFQHLTDDIVLVNDTLVRVQDGDDFVGLYHRLTGQLIHQFTLKGLDLDSMRATYPCRPTPAVPQSAQASMQQFRPYRIHRAVYRPDIAGFQLIFSVLNPYISQGALLANYDYYSVITDDQLQVIQVKPNNFNAEMAHHHRMRTMGQGFHVVGQQYYCCYEQVAPNAGDAYFQARELPPPTGTKAVRIDGATLAIYEEKEGELIFQRELNVPYPQELAALSEGQDFTVLYPRFFRKRGAQLYFTNSKRLFLLSPTFQAQEVLPDRAQTVLLNFQWMPDGILAMEVEQGRFDESPNSYLTLLDQASGNRLEPLYLGKSADVSGVDFTPDKAVVLIRNGEHYFFRTYRYAPPVL